MLSGICHVSLNSQKYPLSPSPFLFPSCSCSTQSSGFPKILKNDSFVFRRGIGVCTIYVSTELNPPWCHAELGPAYTLSMANRAKMIVTHLTIKHWLRIIFLSLLNAEEKQNYKSLPARARTRLASAKEQISLTGVVHLEFIQGELK